MEERTHAPEAPYVSSEAPHVSNEAPHVPSDLSVGAQVPLPFDDEAERPIAFALTARARRTVAPDALPPLRVVPPAEVPDDDPSDTRPARARALRRAGVDLAAIAAQLGVDELLVRAWAGSVVAPRHPSRAASGPSLAPIPASVPADGEAATQARAVRDAARATAARRLETEPHLAAGLGVLAGVAELGPTAITVTTGDPRVAGSVARWLVDVLGADRTTVRLVLRVGPRAAADLARHRWGRAVGLDPDRVRTTRASATVGDADVEGVLRIVDPDLAATAAGWRDALLDGDASAGF
jgi:hypothetical protein